MLEAEGLTDPIKEFRLVGPGVGGNIGLGETLYASSPSKRKK